MQRNEDLFRRVADHIEAHPEEYNQEDWYSEWSCGTTACVAGWACLLSEWRVEVGLARRCKTEPGQLVPDVAAQLLGLAEEEADALFDYRWRPHDGLSVPDALLKIGEGAAIEDVSA